jgi:ATP synthase mitochondrial F1 complex assembly factor 2
MEDRVLHRRQEQAWKKLHDFTEQRLDHAPSVALGSAEAMLMTRKRPNKPAPGLPHPSGLLEQAQQWTSTLDAWHLVALHSICMQAKSFLVGMALLEAHGTKDCPFDKNMEKALEASRVEEEFQIAIWGLVEGGHDYDRLNCSVQLHSAQLMTKMIALDNGLS